MKALSILQPWASLIVGGPLSPGVKRTENRSRAMAQWARLLVGEAIAIHASKRLDLESFEILLDGDFGFVRSEWPYATPREFPTGAIVGTVTLDRTFGPGETLTDDEARFYIGNDLMGGNVHGLSFGNRRWFEPITDVKGALGFWELKPEHAKRVREQCAGVA